MNNNFLKYKRSVAKKILSLLGLPRFSYVYQFIDGTWFEPFDCELPSRYKLYSGKNIINISHELVELKKDFLQDHKDSLYIIGSGPSINKLDLSKLNAKKCIFLNGAVLLHKKISCDFVHLITDSSFVRNRPEIIRELPEKTKMAVSFDVFREISRINPMLAKEGIFYILQEAGEQEKLKKTLSKVYNGGNVSQKLQDGDFNEIVFRICNPNWGLIHTGTVMSAAIQTSIFLGCKETYLLGFDISNANLPRFYESNKDRVRCGLLDDYEQNILPFMAVASEAVKRKGIKIFNCSDCSKLPYSIFPYSDSLRLE